MAARASVKARPRARQGQLTPRDIERLVSRAIKRNGDNTLLLDIKEDLGRMGAGIEHIAGRLKVIEPVLWRLETRRIESGALRTFIGNVFRLRTAVIGGVATALGYLGIHVTGWPK